MLTIKIAKKEKAQIAYHGKSMLRANTTVRLKCFFQIGPYGKTLRVLLKLNSQRRSLRNAVIKTLN